MTIENKKNCDELLEGYHDIHDKTEKNTVECFITESSMLDTLRHMAADGDIEGAIYVLQKLGEPEPLFSTLKRLRTVFSMSCSELRIK